MFCLIQNLTASNKTHYKGAGNYKEVKYAQKWQHLLNSCGPYDSGRAPIFLG